MTVTPTYYINNSRVISGLSNIVYESDVVLLCDTSAGAVNLTLLEIPADRFSTQYKIYVVDQSNNAGTNNITITAPLGFTINNASTFVINVNGGSAIVRIASNTAYIGETNYGFPTGLAVQNEGVTITPSATIMNFVGGGVNATAIGGFVTVDIQGTAVVPVTNAQLLTLISTNAIVPNTWYLVSDAIFTATLLDTVPILVQGVTVNSVSLSGSGIFLNADYQQVGNYSGVSGFVANLGVWSDSLTPVVGDVVMWNNLHYVNLTGNNTVLPNTPQTDLVNWSVLSKNVTNGYIEEVDTITYEPTTNYILSRQDQRNNKIENNPFNYVTVEEAFYTFQWGNDQVCYNTVNEDSYFSCFNNYLIGTKAVDTLGAIQGNTITGFSQVTLANSNKGHFLNNYVDSSGIEITNEGSFFNNKFEQNSQCNISNLKDAVFSNNTFFQSITLTQILNIGSPSTVINNNIFRYSRASNIDQNTGTIERNIFDACDLTIKTNEGAFSENYVLQGQFTVANNNIGTIIRNHLLGGVIQVGNNEGQITTNIVENAQVILESVKTNALFTYNEISQGSIVNIPTMDNNSTFEYNVLQSQSYVTIGTLSGRFGKSVKGVGNEIFGSNVVIETIDFGCEFSSNAVKQNSIIQFAHLSVPSGQVTGNTFTQSTVIVGTSTAEISACEFIHINWTGGVNHSQSLFGGSTSSYVNTIQYSIDLSDPTIYDLPTLTLTIPTHLRSWVGTFNLLNANTLTINKIVGLNTQNAICFLNDFGIVKFTSVAVAGVTNDEIVSSGGATTYNIVAHAPSLSDKIYITLNGSGLYNMVYLTNIFA